ncbi:MAG: ATP-binding protein [Gemmatimonadaceae bacterium]|nr:ATP-binding protein [Gemmatimonadaceae bacterium]
MIQPSLSGGVGRREGAGLLLAGVACVTSALFLRTWSVPYLVTTTAATIATVALVRSRRAAWLALIASQAAMILTCVAAWRALGRPSSSEGASVPGVALEVLQRSGAELTDELQRAARALAGLPVTGQGTSVTLLEPVLPSAAGGEAAGVILRAGVPEAWAGLVRLPLADMALPVGIAHNEFYGVVYARASQDGREAIAMRTLYALAPADQLARPWLRVMADRLGLERIDASRTPLDSAATLSVDGRPDLWLRPVPTPEPERRLALEERYRVIVLTLALAILVVGLGIVWRGASGLVGRLVALLCVGATIGAAPLSSLSNVTAAFNSGYYFSASGGPWTASIGALAMTGALACLVVIAFARDRRWRPPVWVALPLAASCVVGAPYLLRYLARGIELPPRGAPATLWVAWEVALFLVAAGTLLLGVWATSAWRRRGLPNGAAWGSLLGAAAAVLAPVVLEAPGRFPSWYPVLWIAAMSALVITRRSRTLPLHVAFLAACGATTLVWGSITRKRVDLAERDAAGLGAADPEVRVLLTRLLDDVQKRPPPRTSADLLKLYVGSGLAAAANPVQLAVWSPRASIVPDAVLNLARLERRAEGERELARYADSTGTVISREFGSTQGVQLVVGAPLDSAHAITIAVAPRTRLIADDPFAALLGVESPTATEPPYRLTLGPATAPPAAHVERWIRRDDALRGDWQMQAVLGNLHAHAEVELRSLDALLVRGTLLVILDVAAFGLLWMLVALSDRALTRWLRARAARYRRSYRARLTVAIFGAFALPSIAFAIWTYNRLGAEDALSRSLLVQETLRAVSARGALDLGTEAGRLDAPLFQYRQGELVATSDVLFARLAPLGLLLDPVAAQEVLWGAEETANRRITVGREPTLLGYRVLADGSVLAAPARRSELTLERQQRDLVALLAVSMAIGTLVALWLSGLAARAFARPVAALRRAAGDVAAGARELPALGPRPPSEFTHVFETFRRMAVDLSDSRQALDTARRRTEAVLRDVASGVVALDRHGAVLLANPQAERLLGTLHPRDRVERLPGIAERCAAFLAGDLEDDAFELRWRGRQLRGRLTRLSRGDGGAVLTLDDVTDLARAQRVFAWGEMARQVAHEIKNPLTPIRLGVQHVKRAHADGRSDFSTILGRNVARILEEIDRLDEIARSFARFGLRPDDAATAEPVDVARVVRDVVDLERMGDSAITWSADVPGSLHALSREGELREVLLNLLENARLAHARQVTVRARGENDQVHVTVEDDGDGIADDVVARLFEPQFSTRTSGSGLGLAISKRLVESWGGRIRLERRDPRGATASLALVAATPT